MGCLIQAYDISCFWCWHERYLPRDYGVQLTSALYAKCWSWDYTTQSGLYCCCTRCFRVYKLSIFLFPELYTCSSLTKALMGIQNLSTLCLDYWSRSLLPSRLLSALIHITLSLSLPYRPLLVFQIELKFQLQGFTPSSHEKLPFLPVHVLSSFRLSCVPSGSPSLNLGQFHFPLAMASLLFSPFVMLIYYFNVERWAYVWFYGSLA